MKKVTSITSSIIALLFLVSALTSCISLTQNTGKKVVKNYAVNMASEQTDDSTWQTKDLFIDYEIVRESDSFQLSGHLTIKDEVLLSFQTANFFNLYIYFLDKEDKVISIHNVTPNIGYQIQIDPKMKLRNVPPSPPGSESFTFSYWGEFIAKMTSGDKSGSWEIFFNPVEKSE